MPALDAPLPACSRTGCCFGTPTAASPGLVGALLAGLGRDRSRLQAAGERTRCRRTYSDSRTGRRSAVDGRQLAVGGSAAWLRGGGLTRRARWKPLDGLTRAPGLLLTPVPWAQPRGGEVTRRTSQGGRAASTTVVGLRARPARRTKSVPPPGRPVHHSQAANRRGRREAAFSRRRKSRRWELCDGTSRRRLVLPPKFRAAEYFAACGLDRETIRPR